MVSTDMFQAADRVYEAIDGLSPVETRKAILMALVAMGMEGLLVDERKIAFRRVKRIDAIPE